MKTLIAFVALLSLFFLEAFISDSKSLTTPESFGTQRPQQSREVQVGAATPVHRVIRAQKA